MLCVQTALASAILIQNLFSGTNICFQCCLLQVRTELQNNEFTLATTIEAQTGYLCILQVCCETQRGALLKASSASNGCQEMSYCSQMRKCMAKLPFLKALYTLHQENNNRICKTRKNCKDM